MVVLLVDWTLTNQCTSSLSIPVFEIPGKPRDNLRRLTGLYMYIINIKPSINQSVSGRYRPTTSVKPTSITPNQSEIPELNLQSFLAHVVSISADCLLCKYSLFSVAKYRFSRQNRLYLSRRSQRSAIIIIIFFFFFF